jgi:hypothetical protein
MAITLRRRRVLRMRVLVRLRLRVRALARSPLLPDGAWLVLVSLELLRCCKLGGDGEKGKVLGLFVEAL